ncbi:hypothetical protein [Actinoplanes sp. CA-252034]|uniref:hypothetical protein n=1 Tax=Actinoplanes sp. CA-252034 TaxID=3239906 RepID=UPI003D9970F0
MVVLLVATLGLIVAAALAFWPSRDERAEPDRAATALEHGHAEPAVPGSLEGVLTAQLIGGEITRSQYLRAQEKIAARDEERHPMIVPWDAHP